ncbi:MULTISPECIES: nickel-dependent hydrogenase large subunit [unclassified Desulfovibrio]|uniref:hydrogenase large subunit n=1 Tax=unclassified Desulfovibrio TaxID=2593640 RepID=UPI000F5E6A90|nr:MULTISPECIES: nickel-dependent hydrogenase large subunit [unclassified Desulfovibrio]RRD72160.1 carbon monoxide-induced hydrogenase [Desulfovibrio sp. OH1209_COT-279]RRD88315.1 carbon monoxide-induced hydrogenase [Desulfovibrio sp. OH1186_COT-070]
MTTTFTMPLGPVHVALEEPVYFHLTVEGENIRKVELTSGHVHRGMEAMATQRNLLKNVTLTERVCSLCSNSHSFTYCMAVENVLGIVIPPRARYLRVMAEEIKRISSHLFNTAIQAHIIGFKSLFMHVMEVREMMQDLKETVYGNRMNLAANCIGGVKYDVDREMLGYMLGVMDKLEPQVEEIREIYESNGMVLGRTRGLGLLPREDAVRLGVVGPVARGSGIVMDVRKDSPYAAYGELNFKTIVRQGCCIHSRTMVRLHEIFESIGLVRQCVERMPEGELAAPMRQIRTAEACARTEAPRGEVFYFIRTNGTDIPARLKWRVPSYMNWEALGVMMHDCKVADVALITNSIDPCVSCTER